MTKRKTVSFGKIDFYGTGRKINAADAEIELRDTENGPELAICGNVWNARHTDIVSGGQNLDEMAKHIKSAKFREIHRLWKLYHLNSMHAGTEAQDRIVSEHFKDSRYDYGEACEALKEAGLYEDHGYRYGTAWLYREIPDEDLRKIEELIADIEPPETGEDAQ